MAAAIGVSAAGLSNLTPYRPLFILAAVGALWVGFDRVDKQEVTCEESKTCADPAVQKRMKRILAVAFGLVLLFGTAPTWINWVL